jgi:hypothetical protein
MAKPQRTLPAKDRWSAWLRFDQWPTLPHGPGLYEIRHRGRLLKVGIARDLQGRLQKHARSLQGRLLGKAPPPWREPTQVRSSESVLTKQLYFDRSVAPAYDLRTEAGRVRFLSRECRFRYATTATRKAARAMEVKLERSGVYRYVGYVVKR